MTRLILLNGPPRCGKDLASEILCSYLGGVPQKISKELKERTHAFYGLVGLDNKPVRHDYFETEKDTPQECFFGLTPRQAYIAMSENYIKPTHGDSWLGNVLARNIQRWDGMLRQERTHVVSDSGFRGEAEELVRAFGAENVLLVRISRPGYDFTHDSRSYIDLSDLGVVCTDVVNPGDSTFRVALQEAVRRQG